MIRNDSQWQEWTRDRCNVCLRRNGLIINWHPFESDNLKWWKNAVQRIEGLNQSVLWAACKEVALYRSLVERCGWCRETESRDRRRLMMLRRRRSPERRPRRRPKRTAPDQSERSGKPEKSTRRLFEDKELGSSHHHATKNRSGAAEKEHLSCCHLNADQQTEFLFFVLIFCYEGMNP